jgi:carbon monoxide dehydrogenase subunit G
MGGAGNRSVSAIDAERTIGAADEPRARVGLRRRSRLRPRRIGKGRETLRIENEFRMAAAADRLWSHLLDVERIAPCLPGAELTEVVDDRTWRGRMKMKFGPVAMTFAGTVTMVDRDDDDHRVMLRANGTESKGKGAATAEVTSWLEPDGDETLVKMHADITLQGFVAQVSRGMLPDISAKLTQQFADCLRADMSAGESEEAAGSGDDAGDSSVTSEGARRDPATGAAPAARQPEASGPAGAARAGTNGHIGGIRLTIWALYRAAARAVARLFGGKPAN